MKNNKNNIICRASVKNVNKKNIYNDYMTNIVREKNIVEIENLDRFVF